MLGAKRNLACELARGEIIVHWDDDDWMAPRPARATRSAQLGATAPTSCGADRLLYLDPAAARGVAVRLPARPRARGWPATRSATRAPRGRAARSRRSPVGEDTRFVWAASGARLLVLDDHRFLVGLSTARNASPKHTGDPWWSAVPLERVEQLLGDDARVYLEPVA